MIQWEETSAGPAVTVTHTGSDKIGAVVFDLAFILFGSWYYSTTPHAPIGLTVYGLFLCVSVISTILIFRTRVTVTPSRVEERMIRSKTYPLMAQRITVRKERSLIRLKDQEGRILYTFPTGLGHGRELEIQLRRLLQDDK